MENDEIFAPHYRYSNYNNAVTVDTSFKSSSNWLDQVRTTTKKVIYSMMPDEPCEWNFNIQEEYEAWKEWSEKNREKILKDTGYDVTYQNDFEDWYYDIYQVQKDLSDDEDERGYEDYNENYDDKIEWVQYSDQDIINNPSLDIDRLNRMEKTEYGTIYYDCANNEMTKEKWDKEWKTKFYEK